MTQLHEILTWNRRTVRIRSGLSIIEVLTSIVVAMIGVFGVMILIPFAVKQSQVGLDSDAAVQIGRNAYAQFEISGYRNPNNWMLSETIPYNPFASETNLPPAVVRPNVFAIDPLRVTENEGNYKAFPITPPSPPYPEFPLEFRSVNLRIPNSSLAMDLASARRMFRSSDDLVFGDALDDLTGPEQVFDRSINVPGPLRRQSNGRISWSAIVEPYRTESANSTPTERWSYKMHILVFKNRKVQLSDVEGHMHWAEVNVARYGLNSPVGNVELNLNEGSLSTGVSSEEVFRRDDWVMLINKRPPGPGVEPGFDLQIGFYRVVNSVDLSGGASLTLDGPDFNFLNNAKTYIVHLKDVLGVYERTFVPEQESNWN